MLSPGAAACGRSGTELLCVPRVGNGLLIPVGCSLLCAGTLQHQSLHPVLLASPLPVCSKQRGGMAPLQSVPVQESTSGLLAVWETRRGAGLILHPASGEGCELQRPSFTLPGALPKAPWWQCHAWVNRAG